MRLFKGVDLDALPGMFEGCVSGRTLILDGDGPAYRVAATVKRLETAIRRFQQDVLTQMFVTRSETARVHLTSSRCLKAGRHDVIGVKPYQGQRDSKDKPALLEPLREAMKDPSNWLPEFEFVRMHTDLEADDWMIHDAYQLKDSGVVWSDDKDLRMTPYPYYEQDVATVKAGEPMGKLWLKTLASGRKLLGQGPLFFWAQMLMGDSADNVTGLAKLDGKNCGPVAAFEYLKGVQTLDEAANRVIDAYRNADQNPLPEGWMLWLLRWPGDNFYNLLQEVGLSPQNREFVAECSRRVWFRSPDES